MTTNDPLPKDSFARRFALEQAVLIAARRTGDVANNEATVNFTIDTADSFLRFLKGESSSRR